MLDCNWTEQGGKTAFFVAVVFFCGRNASHKIVGGANSICMKQAYTAFLVTAGDAQRDKSEDADGKAHAMRLMTRGALSVVLASEIGRSVQAVCARLR